MVKDRNEYLKTWTLLTLKLKLQVFLSKPQVFLFFGNLRILRDQLQFLTPGKKGGGGGLEDPPHRDL